MKDRRKKKFSFKDLSIKLKITLWFSLFMILLCAVVFVFILFVSTSTENYESKNQLIDMIARNLDKIRYDDGKLKIGDDFETYRHGMYCLIFYEDGTKLDGYVPYTELETEPFSERNFQTVTVNGEKYMVYDRLIVIKHHQDIWLRGVVAENTGIFGKSAVYSAALIALPLLFLMAVAGGYLLAKRSFRPILKINETAEEIGCSGDLSKRIEMNEGKDELHQLAGTFNQMFDRLEKNFDAERHFTSDASHELRTPVTIILAQCEYAFENASGEDELYESLEAIQKQGYRMSRLIESLLQFTRLEQNTETFSPQSVDFTSLVKSVCTEHTDDQIKNIHLTMDIQSDIVIQGDKLLLTRMLENLIINAYKYGVENGHIWVSLKKSNPTVVLSVKDDGIGIPPEDLPKIWNRFYRADKSRNGSKDPGWGLGLAMVQQIVKLHGGSVHVDSTPGNGSLFSVEFTQVNQPLKR